MDEKTDLAYRYTTHIRRCVNVICLLEAGYD